MTNERTNLSKKITHEVRENFGGHIKVFDTTIPRCTKAAESTGIGEVYFNMIQKVQQLKLMKLLQRRSS